jgi:hypothetical protein
MAVKLVFNGTEQSKTNLRDLECYAGNDEIVFIIIDTDCNHDYNMQCIALDKSTAIKLSKELRKQIALLD